ncbi:hypothetical protein HHI36_002999, partial [Cryptolaemus montrouzieri]
MSPKSPSESVPDFVNNLKEFLVENNGKFDASIIIADINIDILDLIEDILEEASRNFIRILQEYIQSSTRSIRFKQQSVKRKAWMADGLL